VTDRVERQPIEILVFSASLRADSLNTRLAQLAVQVIERNGARADRASMQDFDSPSYDNDGERESGLPAGADALRARLEGTDAFVIASPEYNGSMPGLLKNAIDWVSRYKPQPFNERHALLLSASPSMVGGNRGLWALRVPLEHLGARVYPGMFSLAQAHNAFDDDGNIADAKLAERFDDTIAGFLDLVEASKHYPCVNGRGSSSSASSPTPRSTELTSPDDRSDFGALLPTYACGRRSTRRSNCALRATTIVDADISSADTYGANEMPAQTNAPAARGRAITL
jgi:NAD(P)H-dependent FMN reductase